MTVGNPGSRNYRVWVVETRTIEVDVSGVHDEREARYLALRAAEGEAPNDTAVFRRHAVSRQTSTCAWMNNPHGIYPRNQPIPEQRNGK